MKKQNIEIKLVDSWDRDDIVDLYKAGNWWRETWSSSNIDLMIKGSVAFVVAVDLSSGKAIGMGRVISDGVSDAYIQDLVVSHEYQGKGLGKKIVNALLRQCLDRKIQWIGLIAEPGNEKFFSDLGFKTMNEHVPMLYQLEE